MSALGSPYYHGKENYGKQPPAPRGVRRSNNSDDEIDVFEAKRYYFGIHVDQQSSIQRKLDGCSSCNCSLSRKIVGSIKEEDNRKRLDCSCKATRRASLDMFPNIRSNKNGYYKQNLFGGNQSFFSKETRETSTAQDEKKKKKKPQHNQPSSPGGRLVSFFNSIISLQTFSKRNKNKKSKSRKNSVPDEEEVEDSPASSWRTRIKTRRSSFGYFTSTTAASAETIRTTTTTSTRTRQSARTSSTNAGFLGFRTPPPCKVSNTKLPPSSTARKEEVPGGSDLDWVEEKFKHLNGSSDNIRYASSDANEVAWVNPHPSEDDDVDAESDSSSDLFELNLNYSCDYDNRFGYCSSDLPVYESTHMNNIKKR